MVSTWTEMSRCLVIFLVLLQVEKFARLPMFKMKELELWEQLAFALAIHQRTLVFMYTFGLSWSSQCSLQESFTHGLSRMLFCLASNMLYLPSNGESSVSIGPGSPERIIWMMCIGLISIYVIRIERCRCYILAVEATTLNSTTLLVPCRNFVSFRKCFLAQPFSLTCSYWVCYAQSIKPSSRAPPLGFLPAPERPSLGT